MKKQSEKIIFSRYFLLAIVVFLSIIFIWNVLSFRYNDDYFIDSIWFDDGIRIDDSLFWLGYFSISLSYLGSLLGSIGALLVTRKDKNFIYYFILGEILIILSCAIAGLLYTIFSLSLSLIFILISYKSWNNNKHKEIKMSKEKKIFYFLLFVAYIFFWSLLNNFLFINKLDFKIKYLDIIGSALLLYSWVLLMNISKYGFILFGINDIVYLILYIYVGFYSSAASYIVYMSIDIFSYFCYETK